MIAQSIPWQATGWLAGFLFPIGARDSLLHSVQTGSGPHPTSHSMNTGALFPEVMRPVREADHSFPFTAEVKNSGSITPLPIRLRGVGFSLLSTGRSLPSTLNSIMSRDILVHIGVTWPTDYGLRAEIGFPEFSFRRQVCTKFLTHPAPYAWVTVCKVARVCYQSLETWCFSFIPTSSE
jgi:hypothetical protein